MNCSSFISVLLYKKHFASPYEDDYSRKIKCVVKFLHFSENGNLGTLLWENKFLKKLNIKIFSVTMGILCAHTTNYANTHMAYLNYTSDDYQPHIYANGHTKLSVDKHPKL